MIEGRFAAREEEMPLDCKTVYYKGGSMIVGCGSQPCKCGRLAEMFEEDHDAIFAELEAELAMPLPADYVPSGREWWD